MRADIFGLAWSPDSDRLVSCGVDHDVYVWQAATAGARTRIEHVTVSSVAGLERRLQGHVGIIKGVVFDPIGKYIASEV